MGPAGRWADVGFDELGRPFGPGPVDVTVTLTDARGRTVAVAERGVELTRSYPNGQACDGGGYVNGELRMAATDRL